MAYAQVYIRLIIGLYATRKCYILGGLLSSPLSLLPPRVRERER